MTRPSDRARKAAEAIEATGLLKGDEARDAARAVLDTFERETFAAGVEAEEIERDIRTALWNTGCWQGKPQVVAQSFIRHAMEEPCMIRALTAIRNLTPAPPASEGLDADGLRIEMERIAGLTERWEDSLVSQVNTIARAALSAIRPTLDAERAAWEGEVADWLAVKHGDFSNEDSVAIRSGAYRQEQNDA